MMPLSEPIATNTLTPEQQFEQDIALIMQSALERHHKGEHNDAQALYEAIIGAKADHADANYNLAVLKAQTRRAQEALPHFEIALGANPNNGQYWVSYINALHQSGLTPAAWVAVELAQQRGVRGPALDGLIAQMATPHITLATAAAAPGPAGTINLIAGDAAPNATVVSSTAPADARKADQSRLAKHAALFNKGLLDKAIACARELVEAFPYDGACWRALAVSLYRARQLDDTIASASRALELLPDDLVTRILLVDVLRITKRLPEAETQSRRLIEMKPDNAEAHRMLGLVLHAQRRYEEAVAACRRAVELAPNAAPANGTLGVVLLEQGNVHEAIGRLRRAVEIDPTDSVTHSAMLFALVHDDAVDPAQLLEEHRVFGRRHEARVTVKPHANSRDPARQLKVGIISGDLLAHAVAAYLQPVIDHLADDPTLSLHIYYNYLVEDQITAQLREKVPAWDNVTNVSDADLIEKIRRDRIDIMIDLSGHTGRNRLVALAHKPAPIQASWIGYPATTGLKAIDYYLSDSVITPPGEMDDHFIEKIVRMPALAPYLPPPHCPPVNGLPALRNGYVTYGSFNRLNKLRQNVIALWSQVLLATPSARMVIGSIEQEGDRETIIEWFVSEGIDAHRLTFQPRAAMPVYLQQHHHVDVCLDAFPYAGSTTTLNALWMGVPTVTLSGKSIPSRGSASWLSHVGLAEYIAHDQKSFVRTSIAAAQDLDALNRLRLGMRERCLASAPFQPNTVARGLSAALRMMWKRWCEGLSPAAFEVELERPSADTTASPV
ncbi:tetratricopeptide repeat protein [Burkholderia thailandensis]|uniref:tetratricopeptide repeat protein n=1 Tax=Burkholderia thailandensis TaxID=57975 RepID=UPI00016A7DB5|nr:tetratricopeptide repeat protein [Burkholderia thailandensis]AIS94923.1 tetratricopeptide repeat family protein [Burkholderia thailandensis MSMB59]